MIIRMLTLYMNVLLRCFCGMWRYACFNCCILGRTYFPANSGLLVCLSSLEFSDPIPIRSNLEMNSKQNSTASLHIFAFAMHPLGRFLLEHNFSTLSCIVQTGTSTANIQDHKTLLLSQDERWDEPYCEKQWWKILLKIT